MSGSSNYQNMPYSGYYSGYSAQDAEAVKADDAFLKLYDEITGYDMEDQMQYNTSHIHDHDHGGLNKAFASDPFPGLSHHPPPGTAPNPSSTAKVMVKPRSVGRSTGERPGTAEKVSMQTDAPGSEAPTNWELQSTENFSLDFGFSGSNNEQQGAHGDDDDDGQSTCSSCPDSCPSHCGEAGQGSICCDADDCEAAALCVDEACEGANNPCTDEACFNEPIWELGSREDAAAAATLTSFGEPGEMGDMGDPSAMTYPFAFSNNTPANGQNNVHLGFGGMNGSVGGSFNNFDMDPISTAMGYNQYKPWNDPNNAMFLQHLIVSHHAGSSQSEHERLCHVEHSSWMGSKCPLPPTNADPSNDLHALANQDQNFQCNFSATDRDTMTDHIVTQHGQLLNSLDHPDFISQAMGVHQSNAPGFLDTNTGNNMVMQPSENTTTMVGVKRKREESIMTNASLQTTPTLTSDAPSTPSSADLFGPAKEPMILKSEDTPVTGPQTQRQSQSLGPGNVYKCYWRDQITGNCCLENFRDSDALDQHCKEVHTKPLNKQTKYQCMWQSCPRQHDSFATKAKLNRHLQTHTGYKPMVCPICGMRLSAKQALDQHIRTHTEERPYKCEYPGCQQSFKQHSALTMHRRTHTGEKPLVCPTCGEVFGESSNLSKHRRTHNKKGTYLCELCGKDFHRMDQLRRHLADTGPHKHQPEASSDALTRVKPRRANRASLNPEPNVTADDALYYTPNDLPEKAM